MKLNLGCKVDFRQQGYLNVDLEPQQLPSEVYRQGDIQSLDWLIEDNTIEEIMACHCLHSLKITDVQSAIQNWAKKLIIGGIIKITIVDCFTTAKAFVQGQISMPEFLASTFGSQIKGDFRQSALEAKGLCDLLSQAGLTIMCKTYNGVSFYVEATK